MTTATSHPSPIAVTGATGHIGGMVARLLADRGVAQRLIVRDADRAPQLPGSTVATAASFGDTTAMREAFTGCETAFLVSATEAPDREAQHASAIDAAAAAGVKRLVYLSFFKADPNAVFTFARDHFYAEKHIRDSALVFTFLRDNMYADFLTSMVEEDDTGEADGVIRGPAGDGRFAPVAQQDIAEAAVAVLTTTDGRHDGHTYDLTGPELLTMADIAETIGAAKSKRIRFHNETEAEAYESRAVYGAPDWELEAWVSTYLAIAAGELAPVSNGIEQLTGHPATSLAELLRAHPSA